MEKNRNLGTFRDPKTIKTTFKDQWVMGIPVGIEQKATITGIKVLSHGKDPEIVGLQARNSIGEFAGKKVVAMNTSKEPMPIIVFDPNIKPKNFS